MVYNFSSIAIILQYLSAMYTHRMSSHYPRFDVPYEGILYCAPFTDEALYIEQYNKANFGMSPIYHTLSTCTPTDGFCWSFFCFSFFLWNQPHFYRFNLLSLNRSAVEEYFKQPVVVSLTFLLCFLHSFSLSLSVCLSGYI